MSVIEKHNFECRAQLHSLDTRNTDTRDIIIQVFDTEDEYGKFFAFSFYHKGDISSTVNYSLEDFEGALNVFEFQSIFQFQNILNQLVYAPDNFFKFDQTLVYYSVMKRGEDVYTSFGTLVLTAKAFNRNTSNHEVILNLRLPNDGNFTDLELFLPRSQAAQLLNKINEFILHKNSDE